MAIVSSRAVKMAALNTVRVEPELLFECRAVLLSNTPELTDSTVVADLEIVTVAGMAAQTAILPGAAYDKGDGVIVIPIGTDPFVASSLTGLPINITGWAVLDEAGTGFLLGKLLDEPVPINQIGDGVDVQIELPWGS